MVWTFSTLWCAILWLLRDATWRRLRGFPAPPYYRTLLWAAVAITGLFAVGAGALYVVSVSANHSDELMTGVFGLLALGAAVVSWILSSHARYPYPEYPVGLPDD